jgi:hypothetical protein
MLGRLAWAMLLVIATTASAADPAPPTLYEQPGEPVAAGKLDELVFAQWKAAGLTPARPCSDAVFVRRVYLDVIGALPTVDEVKAFLDDTSTDKRAKLIDQLLDRPEYADYWAMRWGDILRVKSEFPINLWPNAVQAYHQWIRESMRLNKPYDRFVRELLTSSGSNFRVPPVNFYRAVQARDPASLARAVALTFMGDRMGSWSADRQAGLASLLSRVGYKPTGEWKEEIIFFDTSTKAVAEAVLPDGAKVKLDAARDPREALADWLISPRNPWFARCAVNRAWYHLLGRGIIHEPDDLRPDNPPSHPELLAYLEKELVAAKWDMKHIYRLILNSSTYQLSSVPRSSDPRRAALFAAYPLRRLDAEVLIDALCRITGTTEEYSSAVPEPFTWVPASHLTVALPDGSISSSFLELFGRPPRDTGMAAERAPGVTGDQRLHLLNSGHVRNRIDKGTVLPSLRKEANNDPLKVARSLYLTILSRYPTDEELKTIKAYVDVQRSKGGNPLADIMWALINSPEFLYRH